MVLNGTALLVVVTVKLDATVLLAMEVTFGPTLVADEIEFTTPFGLVNGV